MVVYPSATGPEGVTLLTGEGVSQSVSNVELLITMTLFLVVYLVLIVAWARVMGRFIKEGPVVTRRPRPRRPLWRFGGSAIGASDDLVKEGE